MKRNDWLLAAGILIVAVVLFCVPIFRGAQNGGSVSVMVDGELFGTYSLGVDQTVDINGSNRLVISGGTARMEWADCPDQVCVHHREISLDGESIICLPNRVVLAVEGRETDREVDGIAR